MDVRTLQGKAVVSLDDAERLGQVSEVLFATDTLRIAGFRVADQGGDYVLPFEGISSVGPDAITVENQDMVRRPASVGSVDHLPGLAQLMNLKVVDESGTYHGTVSAVDADTTTGVVTSLDLEKGGLMGLGKERQRIDPSEVRSVGHDVLTIRSIPG